MGIAQLRFGSPFSGVHVFVANLERPLGHVRRPGPFRRPFFRLLRFRRSFFRFRAHCLDFCVFGRPISLTNAARPTSGYPFSAALRICSKSAAATGSRLTPGPFGRLLFRLLRFWRSIFKTSVPFLRPLRFWGSVFTHRRRPAQIWLSISALLSMLANPEWPLGNVSRPGPFWRPTTTTTTTATTAATTTTMIATTTTTKTTTTTTRTKTTMTRRQ